MRIAAGRKKIRVGDLLVAAGAITEEELQEALAEQKARGTKLGKTLMDMGFISQELLNATLTQQLGIDYIELRSCKYAPIKKGTTKGYIPSRQQRATRNARICIPKYSILYRIWHPSHTFKVGSIIASHTCRICQYITTTFATSDTRICSWLFVLRLDQYLIGIDKS